MKQTIVLHILSLLFLGGLLTGCGETAVPRPYGYYRIALPAAEYQAFDAADYPFRGEVSAAAEVVRREKAGAASGASSSASAGAASAASASSASGAASADGYWFDIDYPTLRARINCTYKPVHGNLRALSDDAQEFVMKHASMANSIPEQGFENPDSHIYGVLYAIRGNTASPVQFYVTDSTHHFLRGAVYFDCVPNQDSLAPVAAFIEADVRHFMETLVWK